MSVRPNSSDDEASAEFLSEERPSEALPAPDVKAEEADREAATPVEGPAPVLGLINALRAECQRCLTALNREVGALIRAGREMKGLMLLNKNLSRLVDLHATLASIYLDVWNNEAALRHFDSQRLKQLGHELAPIRACLKGAGHTEEEIEKHVLDKLRPLGITKTHWVLKEVFVSELVYLVDTLQILVEPDFTLPDATLVSVQGEDEATARYIPPVVKIEVWQRDGGRCVQCKSNEKLEYDHIIPVSKGGSNTARNI